MNKQSSFSSVKQIAQFGQQPQSLLSFYRKKAHILIQLNQLWHQNIESEWRAHSCIANFQENILTIEVDSPAWASQLYYRTVDLLPRLRTWQGLSNLNTIEWYVKPTADLMATSTSHRKPKFLSSKNKVLLQSISETIKESTLKLALQRLAQTDSHERQ